MAGEKHGRKQLSVEDSLKKAIEIVRRVGSTGIPQQDLFVKLGLESKEGIKLVHRMIRRGYVVREKVVVNGRKTYVLFSPEYRRYDSTVSLETAIRIPCFTCPFFKECGVGGSWSPLNCEYMEKWLEEEYERLERGEDP